VTIFPVVALLLWISIDAGAKVSFTAGAEVRTLNMLSTGHRHSALGIGTALKTVRMGLAKDSASSRMDSENNMR
jgi:hypothetical protein